MVVFHQMLVQALGTVVLYNVEWKIETVIKNEVCRIKSTTWIQREV